MTDEEFAEARRKWIYEYVTEVGWTKDKAEVEFDKRYPDKLTYKANTESLNGYGEQNVINKINEIIDYLNKTDDNDTNDDLKEVLEGVLKT